MTNAEAMERTLEVLEGLGRLEDIDTARVQALRSMAVQLDSKPGNSQMWKVYWESLSALLEADDDADDGLAAALAQIASAAEMGDSEAT